MQLIESLSGGLEGNVEAETLRMEYGETCAIILD